MARLNEPPVAPPPPSAEQFDALKRKFIRTNRELAKINSSQQVHIRTLENERSRLVAENCSLAQRVIHLQNTLESQANAPSVSAIDMVKAQLEAKMLELGGLVAELGQMSNRDGRRGAEATVKTATRKAPEERQWRSALGLQEVENAMLPTISEYKAFPRTTMNAEELQDMLDAPDSQSPDIGPPPVSHFDFEEPIAFKSSLSADNQPDVAAEGEEVVLPMNLETRRKRRESGPRIERRRMSVFESPPEGEVKEEPVKILKTGAKRKFSVQQDEDKTQAPMESFQFSRKAAPVSASAEDNVTDAEVHPLSPGRPILSSKPVNTDPVVSPKKQRSSTSDQPEKLDKPAKKPSSRSRATISRTFLPDIVPQEAPELVSTAEVHLESLPPKTPAADTILSPPSTEPSTSRPESKDTPPPGDLSQAGLIARPSRRSRPQVSYKEPSLATKMRRPGKELVDAVTVDPSRRTSVEPPPSASSSAHVFIKEEPEEDEWKPLGATGILRGGEGAEAGSPLRQKADRDMEEKASKTKLNSSAAERAIEKMIEATSTGKRKSLGAMPSQVAQEEAQPPQPQTKETDMAIFEFVSSSPPPKADVRPKITLASAVREKRRHSSVPVSAGNEDRKPEPSARAERSLSTVHKRTVSGTAKAPPAAGLAKSTAAGRERMREREKRSAVLPSSGSTSDMRPKESATEGTREGRAASRRKSMLV